MKKRNVILLIVVILIAVGIVAFVYLRHTYNAFMQTETVKIDDKLTLVLGGGGNSGVLVTDSAIVVIDTKMKDKAEELAKLAKAATDKPIIIINTHYHADHTGGNSFYKGSKVYIGGYDTVFLHKNIKPENMPNEFVKDSLKLNLGNEIIDLYNLGQAHTFDDVVVYLENRKLLFSGDIIVNHTNPVLRNESGANVDKWIAVLSGIINQLDVNSIVPGHGKVGGKEIAENMKSYFEDMKLAATDETKAKEIKAKYADWRVMPMFASPDITIEFIKKNK